MHDNARPLRIFVPRVIDTINRNAQVLNAKSILARVSDRGGQWTAPYYHGAPDAVTTNSRVSVVKLLPWRLWPYHLASLYAQRVDGIFYTSKSWVDEYGLAMRRLLGRPVPVIATFEGMVGDAAREQQLAALAGHPVYCIRATATEVAATDRVYKAVDHIVAISPFMQRIASELYGAHKVSMLPFGIETYFLGDPDRPIRPRPRVIGAGSVLIRKGADLFVSLAERHQSADFVWFGEGQDRVKLEAGAREKRLTNLTFAGSVAPDQLANEMRLADLLVHPSKVEGVPKVVQEGVGCGLPVALFGFYQSPSVIHQSNGLVAWSDAELSANVGQLIADRDLRLKFGRAGRQMAEPWTWDLLAPQWEQLILRTVRENRTGANT